MITYNLSSDQPIGVFDSGLGGLSTLKELTALLPNEKFIFYGDHENAPYGSKSADEVRRLSLACAEKLMFRRVKAIVIACNTATSASAKVLRAYYPFLPIIGAEPAVKPAVTAFPGSEIIVMATEMTLAEEKFRSLCDKYKDMADIIPLPCPGLMEFIERGETDGEDIKSYLEAKLKPVITERTKAIVLGCTHYPFAKRTISEVAGEGIALFDGNLGIAKELSRRLKESGLYTNSTEKGYITFIGSGMSEDIDKTTEKLMELEI